jgi:L-threonylcarbamoyladenylate synthase
VGIESTVLDLSGNPARVLRPGIIHGESLRAAVEDCGLKIADGGFSENAGEPLRSPGRLPRHYSPRAALEILSWHDTRELLAQIENRKLKLGKVHVIAHTVIPSGENLGRVSVIPHDAEAFARAIYAELHQCDELGAERIIVETLPETNEWQAIADRLKRAAT